MTSPYLVDCVPYLGEFFVYYIEFALFEDVLHQDEISSFEILEIFFQFALIVNG